MTTLASAVRGDQTFYGKVIFVGAVAFPAGSVTAKMIAPNAGIPTSVMQHRFNAGYRQESATAAAAEAREIHTVYGATATVVAVKVGSIVANIGAAVVTVDVKKNGVSILSAPVTLNNANAARVVVDGIVSVAASVAGDVYEVVVTATAGGGTLAKGVFASLVIDEDAS